jgi:hypothetical protein
MWTPRMAFPTPDPSSDHVRFPARLLLRRHDRAPEGSGGNAGALPFSSLSHRPAP